MRSNLGSGDVTWRGSDAGQVPVEFDEQVQNSGSTDKRDVELTQGQVVTTADGKPRESRNGLVEVVGERHGRSCPRRRRIRAAVAIRVSSSMEPASPIATSSCSRASASRRCGLPASPPIAGGYGGR